jgi:hypothetical protein
MKNILVITTIFICTLLTFNKVAISQTKLNDNVIVVKPYDPTVGDAYKINLLPEINDTSGVKNIFNYKVYPTQLPVDFQVLPIQPAKMVGEPISKLYSTYLKAGYGNYNTLLGEGGINMLRSKDYSGGFYIKHNSSITKLKLANDFKSPASYSDNNVKIFGKKFFENSTLYGDASYIRNALHYYGYDTAFTDTVIEKKQVFQHYNTITGNAGLLTNYKDSTHINYDVNLKYEYFEDHYKSYQNLFDLRADVNSFYKNELIGGTIGISWINKNSAMDTLNNALVTINPWVRLSGDNWKINCGLAMNVDAYSDSTFYHFYPNVNMQYNVIENFLIPFIGIDGGMIQNHFSKMAKENPYTRPGLQMNNTNNKINIFAGLKGNFSKKISFLVKGTYGTYDNMYFFVNVNDSMAIGNYFDVVYDKVELLHFNGEVSYKNSEKLNIFLKGNYYKYTLKTLDKPWHKPEWDVTLTTRYNLRNKIIVALDVFCLGDRYAPNFRTPDSPFKLKNTIDANIGIEYRYSKVLSAFLNLNNITASKKYYWNFYPTQGFNILGGLTYSF